MCVNDTPPPDVRCGRHLELFRSGVSVRSVRLFIPCSDEDKQSDLNDVCENSLWVPTSTERHACPHELSGLHSPAGPSWCSPPTSHFSPSVKKKKWMRWFAFLPPRFKVIYFQLCSRSHQFTDLHQVPLLLTKLLGFEVQNYLQTFQLLLQIQCVRVLL